MRVVATTVIVSTWDLDTLEDIIFAAVARRKIVSTWDLNSFEDNHVEHAKCPRIVSTWDLATLKTGPVLPWNLDGLYQPGI